VSQAAGCIYEESPRVAVEEKSPEVALHEAKKSRNPDGLGRIAANDADEVDQPKPRQLRGLARKRASIVPREAPSIQAARDRRCRS
jgi:hypothetical protein